MKKNLVILGGGHAHLLLLSRLQTITGRGHRAVLVSPSSYHYYSGMAPGMLGGTYRPEDLRFPVEAMARSRGAVFIKDSAVRIDPHAREVLLTSGKRIPYDILSCNLGSSVSFRGFSPYGDGLYNVKPVEQLIKAQQHIKKLSGSPALKILVIGGGPAAVETAGNAWKFVSTRTGVSPTILLVTGRGLLARYPSKARSYTLKSLSARGITILEGVRVSLIENRAAVLDNGTVWEWDICFAATGIRPPDIFLKSGIATGADRGMLVNHFLQSVSHPDIFGGGDCICFQERPLDKAGVYAVRQGPVLLHNICGALNTTPLRPFFPQKNYLLLFNLGNGKGLFCRGSIVFGGRLCFLLKHAIDKTFVNKFRDI